MAASGFWGHTGDEYNVKNLDAFGGNLDFTYRFGGGASPFFVNVALGAFGGSLQFGCDESSRCDKTADDKSFDSDAAYVEWLGSDAGKKSYGFWNVQERVLAGVDFSAGYFIFGAALGAQLFQGNSDYDDMRATLDDENLVDDVDGNFGVGATSALWFGSYLGRHGQYGNIVAEMDMLYKGGVDHWTMATKLTYAHPSGFFVGASEGSLMSFTVYAGKKFVF